MTDPVYDHLCSIGELIDKLSIENIKCYDANAKILREREAKEPDHALISILEAAARASGEQRVRLRDEINHRIDEAVRRGSIGVRSEVRTYSTERGDPRG